MGVGGASCRGVLGVGGRIEGDQYHPSPAQYLYSGVTLKIARPDMNNYATLRVVLHKGTLPRRGGG